MQGEGRLGVADRTGHREPGLGGFVSPADPVRRLEVLLDRGDRPAVASGALGQALGAALAPVADDGDDGGDSGRSPGSETAAALGPVKPLKMPATTEPVSSVMSPSAAAITASGA